MDFYKIKVKSVKTKDEEYIEISPDFIVGNSKDLMVRGGSFYAIWDAEQNVWSTNEYDVARLVDQDLHAYRKAHFKPGEARVKDLRSFDSQSWVKFKKFVASLANSYHQLDETLTFASDEIKKSNYSSKRLSYDLEPGGDHSAWDELVDVLYSEEERAKIEWAIGAVLSGDSKKIQKFLVFYGAPKTGKSTILNIIHQLFYEYATVFEAKALASNQNAFATEAFKSNPLVAIQHDGDLSRIEDNTKLNSIIAHEYMVINEKYKASYMSYIAAMLFMGTNQPVKISDARSGIIRRLIDINPSGNTVPARKYQVLVNQINFELGAIAAHCLEVYKKMGIHYYDGYRPMEMMYKTDSFFNFVEEHYDIFSEEPGISLKRAWTMYKDYVQEAMLPYSLQMSKFREELKEYFIHFDHRKQIDGQVITSWYSGFDKTKFQVVGAVPSEEVDVFIEPLELHETESLFDEEMMHQPAQYASKSGTPQRYWTKTPTVDGKKIEVRDDQVVDTTLEDLSTKRAHYVKLPSNHIVIDFDLKDDNGDKSLERNLQAAAAWPDTYCEISQGGGGVHCHYRYEGDVDALSRTFAEGIEIKVFTGDSSLRRRLTKCNNVPIASISSGLPLKEKKMLPSNTIQSERGLRELIERNLKKEVHPGTKPSIDFIRKILDDAYKSEMVYDISDMVSRIVAFANNSSNHSLYCLKQVQQMKFKSEVDMYGEDPVPVPDEEKDDKAPLTFFDVEVYPNLFVICWKYAGVADIVRMINPSPQEVEALFKLKLIGYNNRRYDNHILYARYMGYDNKRLYELSQKIIDNQHTAMFGEAYNLSYTDIYDFSSKKQSLKKFMIELGLPHVEMDLPWDQDVPDELIEKVVDYCCNDVMGTEATFEARKQDFVARQILAELSGLSVNDTTQKHTAKIIFGNDRHPQGKFKYTELKDEFEGYKFDVVKKDNGTGYTNISSYRGENPSEGGYVYAEPGMYENVAVLDVASMHPTSIINLDMFGEYTPNFKDLMDARLAIKRKDYDKASTMLDGKLAPFLVDREGVYDIEAAQALSYALKIVINIVYGLTSAKFDNPFRDPRNKDNIVAKRGALFMIDLKHFVQESGFQVVHIKTDSIKIPNASQEIIDEIMKFGRQYGYDFEHEATYDKFCLVNDAVYIAREADKWTAVGAQFQHPYIYKTLFTGEETSFDDLCETKQVTKGVMYLDFEHDKPEPMIERMQFVGRTGRFVPVTQESGGGVLYRVQDDKMYAVTGTKGHLWYEADKAQMLGDKLKIDMSYFDRLEQEAIATIEQFGSILELTR